MTHEGRRGFTTGTCAAAAAKAAALVLVGKKPAQVEVRLPDGTEVSLPILCSERLSETTTRATVSKDAGDDPDVTHGAMIIAEISLEHTENGTISFRAGEGVGTVRKPGLQIPPGEPAINPVPRLQIAESIRNVLGATVGCTVTISIPGGSELAERTFNPRLGIEGGLSIIGTHGRVEAKSTQAWVNSLRPQIDVAIAAGHTHLILVPGHHGETVACETLGFAREAVIQTSNFIGELLTQAAQRGAKQITLIGHAGKLVKVAAGIFQTHSQNGDARLETVAALAGAAGAPYPLINRLLELPTVEAAIELLSQNQLDCVWSAVARRAAHRSQQHAGIPVRCIVTGYGNRILGDSLASAADIWPKNTALVVGIGPFGDRWLTPEAWQWIHQAQVVAGGQRQVEACAQPEQELILLNGPVKEFCLAVESAVIAGKRTVVVASGDPSFFGILNTLQRFLTVSLQVVPGVSSLQLALARLGISDWRGLAFASAHGREVSSIFASIDGCTQAVVLTDSATPPQVIAGIVAEKYPDCLMTVCECLGSSAERVTAGSPKNLAEQKFAPLSVVHFSLRRPT